MNEQAARVSAKKSGYIETVRQLASAQKAAAPGAPAYSILVNRRAGRLLAAWAYRAGLTPNMVTVISAMFTFAAIGLLAVAQPTFLIGALVWFLLAVGYAFDSADGQVARLRGGGSLAGEWLDHVVDSLKISSLHLAVLITAFRHFEWPGQGWLLVPIAFCAVAAVSFFAMILNDHLKEINSLRTGSSAQKRSGSVLRSLMLIPTDYGFLCLIFLTLGAESTFVVLYSLLFVANAAHLAMALHKWFRAMTALDRANADDTAVSPVVSPKEAQSA